jgi:DNA-binding beta-propeller fold protein YncE
MMAVRKRNRRKLYVLLVPAIVAAAAAVVVAAKIDAVVELGQPNFTTSGFLTGATQTAFALPYGVAIDRAAGHLYIADTANNRILGWSSVSALTNGAAADLVIGQPGFSTNSIALSAVGLNQPWSVAVDSNGNLYVSDNGNNRVLEYNSPYNAFGHACNVATPCEGGLAASLVLGQGTGANSFTTNSSNCTTKNDASCFDEPSGIAIDSNDNLFVTDTVNDRLLVFLNPLATPSGCNSSGCAGDVIADFSLGECTGNSGFLDGEGVRRQNLSDKLAVELREDLVHLS